MDKCARKLDKPLVEQCVGLAALGEPNRFQHFVGFEVQAAIETLEICQVMGVESSALELVDDGGDVQAKSLKSKV